MLKNYRTLVEMSNQITVAISLHQIKKKLEKNLTQYNCKFKTFFVYKGCHNRFEYYVVEI